MLADLSSSIDGFLRAAERFFDSLASIDWLYFALALLLWAGMLLARSHAWANGLRAAYPDRRVDERGVAAAFLAGAGLNGFLPARAGDAVKIFLAKRSIPGSSYPAILSSYAILAPFDTLLAALTLAYGLTLGLLPEPPDLTGLPAFEISFWAEHPELLLFVLTALAIGSLVLFAFLARRVSALWAHLKQGVAIFREPRLYLRRVAGWQLAGWLCRFFAFWLFLEAFRIGGSFENVLLVMAVESVAKALPLTPGGAGAQQALLVASLHGPSRAAVLAFSAGQQIAVAVWAAILGFLSLALVFRTRDWRALLRRAEAEQRAAEREAV
jgi:uncharacterized membrane protein YbhN (UPF0104 family)